MKFMFIACVAVFAAADQFIETPADNQESRNLEFKQRNAMGGWSDWISVKDQNSEIMTLFTTQQNKDQVEAHINSDFDIMNPVKYKQQVVNGMKYQVVYDCDDDKQIVVDAY